MGERLFPTCQLDESAQYIDLNMDNLQVIQALFWYDIYRDMGLVYRNNLFCSVFRLVRSSVEAAHSTAPEND